MSDLSIIAIQHETTAAQEAKRVFDICNACRYCEGFCATFQALSGRREVQLSELDYLTNLCHNCTACYHACQYSPPHEFNINAPLAFSTLRVESYQRYAWPHFMGVLFHRNGLVVSIVTALILTATMLVGSMAINRDTLFAEHVQPGAFYRIVSHEFIVVTAGSVFLLGLMVLFVGIFRFSKATGVSRQIFSLKALWQAVLSSATLRYLGGGHGEGCNTENESFSNARRVFHQFTMWGFLLCFAATTTAAFYETFLGRFSPFPYFSLPVVLGTLGGLGLLVGPAGLAWKKRHSDPRPMNIRHYGMDYGFLALLFLVSLTGLVLLVFRETTAMGMLMLIHLGFVFSLFLTLPYSKFVHAFYRFTALVIFHGEELQRKAKS